MKYLAKKLSESGIELLGSDNALMFELKTDNGAIRRSARLFKTSNFILYKYPNSFYGKGKIVYFNNQYLKNERRYKNTKL